MKKNKIIGLLVAVVGVGVAVSTSYALYSVIDENQSFDITLTTPSAGTGTVNYLYGDVTNSLGSEKLSPENRSVTYTVPLKAEYGIDVPSQPYVVGNIGIKVTGDLLAHVDVTASMSGYTDDTVGANTYGGAISITEGAGAKDVAVKTDGTQKVNITLTLKDSVTSENFLTYAEMGYNVALTWDKPADFNYAYVVGDKTGWADFDEYKMVPNIQAKNWEWMYLGLTGFNKMKVKSNEGWLSGDDITITSGTSYDVYWSGALNANLTPHQSEGKWYISAQ